MVYFHNPEYERRAQERKRVADVATGIVESTDDDKKITALQILPPLLQLYPEVEVLHADDSCCLTDRVIGISEGGIGPQGNFCCRWMFAGRTLYLVVFSREKEDTAAEENCPFSSCMRVLHSRNVAPLLQAYLKLVAGQDRSAATDVSPA